MDLLELPVGATARITSVDLGGPADVTLRLRELGLRPGAVLQVVNRAAFGGRVLAVCSGAAAQTGTAEAVQRRLRSAARLGVDARTVGAIRVAVHVPRGAHAPHDTHGASVA